MPGKLTKRHKDGTYDVLYDDGKVDERVLPMRIRQLNGAS